MRRHVHGSRTPITVRWHPGRQFSELLRFVRATDARRRLDNADRVRQRAILSRTDIPVRVMALDDVPPDQTSVDLIYQCITDIKIRSDDFRSDVR